MSARKAWRRRLPLCAAAALVVAGLNLLSFSSARLLALSLALVTAGVAWFAGTLVIAGRREGKPWKSNIALILVSSSVALIGLLLPTLTVRVGSRLSARWQRFDADLGWVQDDDTVVGQRMDRIDPTRQHVLVMGDSILYGQGIEKRETAPVLLGEMLPSYQVLNLSISGYSIDQYFLFLRRVLPRTHPRLVIVGIYAGNDFEITSREYGWGHSKPLFVEEGGRLVRQNPNLLQDNCIDRLAQSLLFRVIWSDHDFAQLLLDHLCDARQLELDEAERAIAAMFRAMDADARSAGAHILYILLPEQRNFVDHAGSNPSKELYYLSMYRRLRRLLEDGRHEFFEFAGDIARSGTPFKDLFLDQGHFLPRGHVLLAEALRREIGARHLLDEP